MPNRYLEGPDSTFTHLGKTYRVDDLIDVSTSYAEYTTDCDKLMWIFDTAENRPDPRKVAKVDTTIPIIITQLIDGSYVVLDGLHRLAKTVVDGSSRIRVKFIPTIRLAELPEVPQDHVVTWF